MDEARSSRRWLERKPWLVNWNWRQTWRLPPPPPDRSIDEIAAVVKHRPVSSPVSRSLLPSSLCPFLFIRGTTKRLNLAPYIHPRRKNTSFDFHSTKKRACNCYSIRLAITVFFFFFLVKSYTSRPSSHQFITGKLISRILVESNQLLNSIPVYFSIPFRSFAYFSRVVINRGKEPVEINYSREKKGYF